MQSDSYVEKGDLPEIQSHKNIRILIQRTEGNVYLPRSGYPLDIELEQIAKFAKAHNLSVSHVYVPDFDQLIPELLNGHGDIIAANYSITDERKEFIDFTLPTNHAIQQLVIRSDDNSLKNISSLKGKKLAIKPAHSFWSTAQKLKTKYPGMEIIALSNDLDTDIILDKLAQGEFDATILDSNVIRSVESYRNDIKRSINISKEEPVAWGIRQNSPLLKEALDTFIRQQKLSHYLNETYIEDWKGIKKRKSIRVLTRNNAANYFLYRGELMGFEYELSKKFADEHGLRLEIIVPPGNAKLIDWLNEGKGDFIAASLTPTKERIEKGLAFSRPYNYTTHQLVSRSNDNRIQSLDDLNGKTISIRKSSAYVNTLRSLLVKGINFKVEYVPETMETEDIINRIAIGQYDFTISDAHILDLELKSRDDVKSALTLSDTLSIAWATRKENTELLKQINKFHKKTYKGLFYNLTYQKYFDNPELSAEIVATRQADSNQLSPYDDLVKTYSEKYNLDWRLVTAQMYQESKFNPEAKSWAGALGLLQLMPKTARQFGFKNIRDPETGIHAGLKYLSWVQQRFDEDLPVKDRMWFTLAAYNAGVGHVRDARRLARRMGWNPDRWFNNVERAMLLLRFKKYYRNSRFGYVRGREPVTYVRKIKHLYESYLNLYTIEPQQTRLFDYNDTDFPAVDAYWMRTQYDMRLSGPDSSAG